MSAWRRLSGAHAVRAGGIAGAPSFRNRQGGIRAQPGRPPRSSGLPAVRPRRGILRRRNREAPDQDRARARLRDHASMRSTCMRSAREASIARIASAVSNDDAIQLDSEAQRVSVKLDRRHTSASRRLKCARRKPTNHKRREVDAAPAAITRVRRDIFAHSPACNPETGRRRGPPQNARRAQTARRRCAPETRPARHRR